LTEAAGKPEAVEPGSSEPGPEEATLIGSRLSFRLRLTLALLLTAVAPLAGFGLVLLTRVVQRGDPDPALRSLLLLGIAAAAILGVLVALLLASDLTAPLRAIASAVERVSRGDLSSRIEVVGTDELALLAESHNRLAADLERRNRELRSILAAIEEATPSNGVEQLIDMATRDARAALGMIDASILLADPQTVPVTTPVPGEPRPVRAILRLGDEIVGVFVGRLPATRIWEPADQDLLELFAAEIAVAIRNAQLFARVEAQNARLLETVLEDFGVKGQIVKVRPGPVVTLYELEPAPGTKSARVIGHLTARMLLRREGTKVQVERVIDAARANGVALEINSQPHRLDLCDSHARLARDRGVKLVIDSDAHYLDALDYPRWGVLTARRAWLTKDDVLNTLPLKAFRKALRRNR